MLFDPEHRLRCKIVMIFYNIITNILQIQTRKEFTSQNCK